MCLVSRIYTEEFLVIIYIAESFYELHLSRIADKERWHTDLHPWCFGEASDLIRRVLDRAGPAMLAREMPERVGGGSAPLTLNLLPVCKSAHGLPNLACIPRTGSSRLFLVLRATSDEFTPFFVRSIPEISSM